jgi:uncharacterized protein YfcZ (UPF0381/DUF406 family)
MKIRVLCGGKATVKFDPQESEGMSSFEVGTIIKYEKCASVTKQYYRIRKDEWEESYYELCSLRAFSRFFKVIKNE